MRSCSGKARISSRTEETSPKCIWPHPRLPKTALFKENNKALLHFKLISQGSQLFGRIREELITSTFPGKNILLFASDFHIFSLKTRNKEAGQITIKCSRSMKGLFVLCCFLVFGFCFPLLFPLLVAKEFTFHGDLQQPLKLLVKKTHKPPGVFTASCGCATYRVPFQRLFWNPLQNKVLAGPSGTQQFVARPQQGPGTFRCCSRTKEKSSRSSTLQSK